MYLICTGSLTEMITSSLSLNYGIGLHNWSSDGHSRLESFFEYEFWQVKELVLGLWTDAFFQEPEQMEWQKSRRGCCRGIRREPRWILSGSFSPVTHLVTESQFWTSVALGLASLFRHSLSCHLKTLEGRGLIGENKLEQKLSFSALLSSSLLSLRAWINQSPHLKHACTEETFLSTFLR